MIFNNEDNKTHYIESNKEKKKSLENFAVFQESGHISSKIYNIKKFVTELITNKFLNLYIQQTRNKAFFLQKKYNKMENNGQNATVRKPTSNSLPTANNRQKHNTIFKRK